MELTNEQSIIGQLSEEEKKRLEYYSDQESVELLSDEEFISLKKKFNQQVTELNKFADKLYTGRPNKEVYDALITVYSVKELSYD